MESSNCMVALRLCGTMLALLLAVVPINAAEKLPSKIVTNVQANEALYPSVEVKWRREFKSAIPGKDHASMPPFLSKRMTERYHSINRDEKSYLEYTCDAVNFADEKKFMRTRQAFDGKVTRVDTVTLGHIYNQRVDPSSLFRPHTWAFWRSFVTFPLSVWLRGGEEVKSHPSKTHSDKYNVAYLDGNETIDGLHCIRVRIDTHHEQASGQLSATTVLCLAPERNYLPLKAVYSWPTQKEILEEIRVDDLRELKPGLWFPHHYKLTSFDEKDGKPVVRNEEEGFVESVSLEPSNDNEIFSNIRFSPHATVYEVTGDQVKDITKEYHAKHNSGGLYIYLLGGALTLVVLAVVYVTFRRARGTACASASSGVSSVQDTTGP